MTEAREFSDEDQIPSLA